MNRSYMQPTSGLAITGRLLPTLASDSDCDAGPADDPPFEVACRSGACARFRHVKARRPGAAVTAGATCEAAANAASTVVVVPASPVSNKGHLSSCIRRRVHLIPVASVDLLGCTMLSPTSRTRAVTIANNGAGTPPSLHKAREPWLAMLVDIQSTRCRHFVGSSTPINQD